MVGSAVSPFSSPFSGPLIETVVGFSAAAAAAKSLQSCPTLCDPRDGSPPGSPVTDKTHLRNLFENTDSQVPEILIQSIQGGVLVKNVKFPR